MRKQCGGWRRDGGWVTGLVLAAAVAMPGAQTGGAARRPRLSLVEAVREARVRYPAVAAAEARVSEARAGTAVVRTSYLPTLRMLEEVNWGTAHNTFGTYFPEGVLPPISGPVAQGGGDGAWGSATGILAEWEVTHFGYRHAEEATARQRLRSAEARTTVSRLDVEAATARSFLRVIADRQRLASAHADVERRKLFVGLVEHLVTAQLRAGADAERANAEWAAARIRVINAQARAEEDEERLNEWLGRDYDFAELTDAGLDQLPLQIAMSATPQEHPLAQAEQAEIRTTELHRTAVGQSGRPQVKVEYAAFARGSGLAAGGVPAAGAAGLAPAQGNWAVGLSVSFSAFRFARLHAEQAIDTARSRGQQDEYRQTVLALQRQWKQAQTETESARAVAQETPIELRAARLAATEAAARYRAGLAALDAVAEAQALLARADAQDRLARLRVWAAVLAESYAAGDLQPFLDAATRAQGGR